MDIKINSKSLRQAVSKFMAKASVIAQSPIEPMDRMVSEPWYIDSVETLPGARQIKVTGWALPDPSLTIEANAERFAVNGKRPIAISYPIPRPDVQDVFWQRKNATLCGFQLVAEEEYPGGVMQVSCHDTLAGSFAKGQAHWYLADPGSHETLPDADRRFRVIGNRDPHGFLRLGATDAYRIAEAYHRYAGKPLAQAGSVLDWGVGCGRVARHLAPLLGDRFFGCDIDADNVRWCAKSLVGNYTSSKLEPPLPFGDSSFDVVYGIFVFTHLRAEWELRWLKELNRVLKPGGVMLVTVHGQTAIDFAQLDPLSYKALQDRVGKEGLAVTSSNNQLDGFVEHPEEYVNVFHSHGHIQQVWGRYFNQLEILPGYIFTHDLVIGRGKK